MKAQRTPPRRESRQREPEQWDLEQLSAHWGSYAEYSKTLRAWLVAYGIGGPLLLFTNASVSAKFAAASNGKLIVILFLLGVAGQVLLALINKWSAWHTYASIYDQSYLERGRFKFWTKIHELDLIDLFLDLASIVCFSIATVLAFLIMFNSPIEKATTSPAANKPAKVEPAKEKTPLVAPPAKSGN